MQTINLSLQQIQNFNTWHPILKIAAFMLIAWAVNLLANLISRLFIGISVLTAGSAKNNPERRSTLEGLFASILRFGAFVIAFIASVGQFLEAQDVVWVVGLFSAAFGLGARPLISDLLAGLTFIFKDTFSVGEKVEVSGALGMNGVQGVVEKVSLQATHLRAPTGELYLIPNGELRTVRNFSRGRFSIVRVSFYVAASDLSRALGILEDMRPEAVIQLPNLLEPWQVISEEGVMGETTQLTIIAKSKLGQAAEMRPRMLAFIQDRFEEEQIQLGK